jgi:hypothetical protein
VTSSPRSRATSRSWRRRPSPGPDSEGPRGARVALVVLVLLGAGLRLWQYFANTSFWIDEIALAENVLRLPLRALLTEPLALDQVAPPGFLALSKGSAGLFGPSEMALRLVPMLSGLAALALFPILSRRFQRPWIAVFGTGLFAVAPTLIEYSGEFKQYSTEVAAAVVLTLAAFGLAEPAAPGGRYLRAAALGAIAVWFSQGAVFMVAGLGTALVLLAFRDRARGLPLRLAGLLVVWAASAGAAALSGLHRVPPAMSAYLNRFWSPSVPAWPVLVFVVVAALALWKRDTTAALLFLGPAAFALLAAALRLYPFSGRAVAFLAPAAILAIAECAGWFVEGLARLGVRRRVAAAIPALALVAVIAQAPPVYRDEDTRPVLARLARLRQPGDGIYVSYAAARAFRFYGPRVGLSGSEATFGGCHRGDPRSYLRELDHFRGRPRVWVFRTHEIGALGEGPALDGYLARMGTREERIRADGVTADLWDLSHAGALPADAAESHPLPAFSSGAVARFGCGHGPIGKAPWD